MANPIENSQSYLIPAATGGWNTRDPWYNMPENDALTLDNVFPDTSFCRVRGGAIEWADIGAGTVHTLATLTTASGSEKLVAVCDTAIVDITAGGAGTSIKGAATITSNEAWQHVVFRNRLFMVNGVDQPLDWTGAGNVNVTAWTDATATLTISNLINVSSYKSRLYFVEKASSKVWYTSAVDNITGPLVAVNFQSLLNKGGYVLYAGPTSTNISQTNNQQLFVVVSNLGEVLVYEGDNPGSSTWNIVGRYFIGRALGRRCCFDVAGDLNIITYDGVIPLSTLLSGVDVSNAYLVDSGKIKPSFNSAALVYGDNKMWMGINYPAAHYILVNIPISDFGNCEQYVMNTITKAWCKFTGERGFHSFATWKNSTYIGEGLYAGSKTDGKVYLTDVANNLEPSGSGLTYEIQQAYNFLGDPNSEKIITYLQPYISILKVAAGAVSVNFAVGTAIDYETLSSSLLPSFLLSAAGNGATTFNRPLLDASGSGKAFSLRIRAGNNGLTVYFYSAYAYTLKGAEIA